MKKICATAAAPAVFAGYWGFLLWCLTCFPSSFRWTATKTRLMTGLPQVLQSPLRELSRKPRQLFCGQFPLPLPVRAAERQHRLQAVRHQPKRPGAARQGRLAVLQRRPPAPPSRWPTTRSLPGINDSEETLARASAALQNLSNDLAEHGCTLVLDFTPSKDRIYREYMPDGYPIVEEENRTDRMAAYLQSHTTVPVVWPVRNAAQPGPPGPRAPAVLQDRHPLERAGRADRLDGIFEALGLPTLPPEQLPRATDRHHDRRHGQRGRAVRRAARRNPTYAVPGYALLFEKDDRVVRVIGDSFSEYYMPYLEARFAACWNEHIDHFDPALVNDPSCDILILEFNERSLDTMLRILENFAAG